MFICTVPRRPHTQTGGAGDKCGGGGGDATGDTQGGDGSDDVAGGGGSGEAAGELCACRTDDPLRSHSVVDYAANILPHRRIYCRTDDPLRSHSPHAPDARPADARPAEARAVSQAWRQRGRRLRRTPSPEREGGGDGAGGGGADAAPREAWVSR